MCVRQEHLAERERVVGNAEPIGKDLDNRPVLSGDICIDQDDPITIADREANLPGLRTPLAVARRAQVPSTLRRTVDRTRDQTSARTRRSSATLSTTSTSIRVPGHRSYCPSTPRPPSPVRRSLRKPLPRRRERPTTTGSACSRPRGSASAHDRPGDQFMQPAPTPEQIVYAEMPAGSVVVYTGGTVHAGGSNTTAIPRRGAHLSYCLGWLRTEEMAGPPAIAAKLPRQAQELLALLRSRQRPPRRRLSRHGADARPGRALRPRRPLALEAARVPQNRALVLHVSPSPIAGRVRTRGDRTRGAGEAALRWLILLVGNHLSSRS